MFSIEVTPEFANRQRKLRTKSIQSRIGTVHPDISGKYVCQKKINMHRAGETVDSSGGKIHGVWHPTESRVVLFTDTEYFKPYQEIVHD